MVVRDCILWRCSNHEDSKMDIASRFFDSSGIAHKITSSLPHRTSCWICSSQGLVIVSLIQPMVRGLRAVLLLVLWPTIAGRNCVGSSQQHCADPGKRCETAGCHGLMEPVSRWWFLGEIHQSKGLQVWRRVLVLCVYIQCFCRYLMF